MARPPIVCSLPPAELVAQRQTLLPGLVARATGRTPLPGGFRWRFDPEPDLLAALAGAIEAERCCCRFLEFRVTLEADGGPVWLDVTGPDGTVAFLEQLVAERAPPAR